MKRLEHFNQQEVIALNRAIRKWHSIALKEALDLGSRNCFLCHCHSACETCPISLYVGDTQCVNTPYDDWLQHHEEEHDWVNFSYQPGLKAICPTCTQIAQEMEAFLHKVKRQVILSRKFQPITQTD